MVRVIYDLRSCCMPCTYMYTLYALVRVITRPAECASNIPLILEKPYQICCAVSLAEPMKTLSRPRRAYPLQLAHHPLGPPPSIPHQTASRSSPPQNQCMRISGSTPRPRREHCHSCQNVEMPAPTRGIPWFVFRVVCWRRGVDSHSDSDCSGRGRCEGTMDVSSSSR
jgi:hypothetical protein